MPPDVRRDQYALAFILVANIGLIFRLFFRGRVVAEETESLDHPRRDMAEYLLTAVAFLCVLNVSLYVALLTKPLQPGLLPGIGPMITGPDKTGQR